MSDEQSKDEIKWTMSKARDAFVNFFKENGHTHWPSSPCVPLDDPTLLFINAGMNQYKPLFLGTCDPNNAMSQLKRAANTQKCIRAGGKHNDLEDVGKDVYHHTFFEMLGNWSFGDYFKEEAIDFAWRCLTEVYGLDPSRMYATFFEGNDQAPRDVEAQQLWLKYLPSERVIPCSAKDNFWEMGATGPCGPCTEIHYDRIGNRIVPELVNADLPELIEIWNVVFIQYNRENDGSLRNLPDQHVDTGMGFERLVSILQNVPSNYDTDVFQVLFEKVQQVTNAAPYTGLVGEEDAKNNFRDMAYRVIVDHLRTLSFSIADGALPSNEGRGYVLRRILRRAVRYGRQNLGAELGFFSQLVGTLVDHMGDVFPELVQNQEHIVSVIREEETSFSKTLDRGLAKFSELAADLKAGTKFPSDAVHLLYTTHGFPIDLTELMAEEHNLSVDTVEVEELMEAERQLSRDARDAKLAEAMGGKDMSVTAEQTSYLSTDLGLALTNDDSKYLWSSSSDDVVTGVVKAIYAGRQEGFVDSFGTAGETIGLVLDTTCFYAEAGGQIYDTGSMTYGNGNGNGGTFTVSSVQSYGGYTLHLGTLSEGAPALSVDTTLSLLPDYSRRASIAANHTLTHVLNLSLRNVLCDPRNEAQVEKLTKQGVSDIKQKGSFVDETKLRFDFTFPSSLSEKQLAKVEEICKANIANDLPVFTSVVGLNDGIMDVGALRAVFGEVYPDPVRVVSVGADIAEVMANPQEAKWYDYSVEFCGGTHLKHTGEAGSFVLLGEEGIAKGVRRITAVTGQIAKDCEARGEKLTGEVTECGSLEGSELDQGIKDLTNAINQADISASLKIQLREMLQSYSKKLVAFKKAQEKELASAITMELEGLVTAGDNASTIVLRRDFGINGKLAKQVLTSVGKKFKTANLNFMLLSADADDQKVFVAATSLNTGKDCNAWIKSCTEGLQCRGGGKKDSSQYTVDLSGNSSSVEDVCSEIIAKGNAN